MNITLTNWRADRKGTRQGYCDLRLVDIGLTVKNISIHESSGKYWIALPAGESNGPDGKLRYWSFLSFDEAAKDNLRAAAVKQLRMLAPEIFNKAT
jgi:hypothetical protein